MMSALPRSLEFVPLERFVLRAPLGVRFTDLALGDAVTDGLDVIAGPLGLPAQARPAERSHISGIYGFETLPGLEAYRRGERPATDWCPPSDSLIASPPANFVLQVQDRLGRFLPQTLLLCVPRESLLRVPLFSAPTRPAPVGLAVVRGLLRRSTDGQPAAWALVSFTFDSLTSYAAVADARGAFVAFLPYAEALPALVGSPPHGTAGLEQLSWSLQMRARYSPASQQAVGGLGPEAPPEMRSILAQQLAQIESPPGVPGPVLVSTLRFGAELRVVSQGVSDVVLRPA